MAKDKAEKIIEEYFGKHPEEKKLLELLSELSELLGEIPDLEELSEVNPE